MSSLILNTVYHTEKHNNSIEIGLNQFDQYTPVIKLTNTTRLFDEDNEFISLDDAQAVVFTETEWSKFSHLFGKIKMFFSSLENFNDVDEEIANFTDEEIGNYVLVFNEEEKIIQYSHV